MKKLPNKNQYRSKYLEEIKSKKTKLFLIRIVLFTNIKNINTIQTHTKTEKHNNNKKESKISNIIEFAKKNILWKSKQSYGLSYL